MKLIRIEPMAMSERIKLIFEDGSIYKTQPYVAADFGLAPGCELDEARFSALKAAMGAASAKDRAVRIVASTAISEKELRRRLEQKGEDAADSRDAVDWLKELSLLDDRRTAELLVQSAVNKGYGAARIKNILFEKGIPKEYWDDAMADLPKMDDAIDNYLARHLSGREPDEKLIKKTVDALLRRGHSWKDIQEGLRRFRDDLELDGEIQEEFP